MCREVHARFLELRLLCTAGTSSLLGPHRNVTDLHCAYGNLRVPPARPPIGGDTGTWCSVCVVANARYGVVYGW